MSEAYGTVALKLNETLTKELKECTKAITQNHTHKILLFMGIDPSAIEPIFFQFERFAIQLNVNHDYCLDGNTIVKKGYVCLDIFGEEWTGLVHLLVTKGKGEIYANISDEYGTHFRFGKNSSGQTVLQAWEDDGDEMELDDFDEEKHEKIQSDKDEKWKNFVPKELKRNLAS